MTEKATPLEVLVIAAFLFLVATVVIKGPNDNTPAKQESKAEKVTTTCEVLPSGATQRSNKYGRIVYLGAPSTSTTPGSCPDEGK